MSGPDTFGSNPYLSASNVSARVVLVLRGHSCSRGLQIEPFRSRAVLKHEIHELMVTDIDAGLGSVVDRVSLLGFVEIVDGGVITSRSNVTMGDQPLGNVIGFDQTHAPNHLNICIFTSGFFDGLERGLKPGDEITFSLPPDE